jgi:hypothetical protein
VSEISEERRLERSPMFQSKVREVFIQTVHDDVHEIHALLQFRNSVLPLPLHPIQQKHGSRMSRCDMRRSKPRIFVPGLFPELGGGVVGGQEVHGNLVVVGNAGGSIVEVLLHVIGRISLERWGKVEGGSSSVEDSVVGNERRHGNKSWLEGSGWFGGSGKETMEGTIINPPDLNTS